MAHSELALLSPYRPPTAYAVSLSDRESAAWLNAWHVLWQPAVLVRASHPPSAASPYDHNDPLPEAVYALPESPALHVDDDWKSRCAAAGALAVPITADRGRSLQVMHESIGTAPPPAEFARMFGGIGYGYLLLQTLFDASHHPPLLNVESFWNHVRAGAESAISLDMQATCEHLKRAAEELHTAREGLAPGGIACFNMLSLTADNLSSNWPAPFDPSRPLTLIATSACLKQLASEHRNRFEELAAACRTPGAVSLAIGAVIERHDALLPMESQLWSLTTARAKIRELLGIEPMLFGRGSAEFHPQSPSWLRAAGFDAAIVHNPEAATLPFGSSSLVHWPGPDGHALNAFARDPLPAHEPQTFFNLGHHLHEAVSRDSTPSLCLMHSKAAAAGYDDWLALAELADVIGPWPEPAAWIRESHSASYIAVPGADDFAHNTLESEGWQRDNRSPVTHFAEHARLRRRLDAAFSHAALAASLSAFNPTEIDNLKRLAEVEQCIESGGSTEELAAIEQSFAESLANRILARSHPSQRGWLVLNPTGSTRRVALELESEHPIPAEGAVKAADWRDGVARAVVEVPSFGFAWLPRGAAAASAQKSRLRTAEGATVRNEFIEAEFDPATGAIKSIRDSRMGVTRFGQMLIWQPGSRMVATECRITHCSTALGEITSRGELRSESNTVLARFSQRVRAWAGRPALEISIELQPTEMPIGYPWHAYFGCRFAWRDDRASLYRGSHGLTSRSDAHRPLSTDFFEIRYGKERSAIFTGGLPFLQKHSSRAVDIILIPPGETGTHFELLIAFDREFPAPLANTWIAPAPALPVDRGPPPSGPSGWLAMHDLPSICITSLRPAVAGRAITARLLETAGFPGSTALRFARRPARATLIDLNGARQRDLVIDDGDACQIDFSANELLNARLEWE